MINPMKSYALLIHPGHNRVYYDNARNLMIEEIKALSEAANIRQLSVEPIQIAEIPYIKLDCEEALTEESCQILGRLSAFFALYEIVDGHLQPILCDAGYRFPENINTILKYIGKTNEQFTHLMVNLATAACRTGGRREKAPRSVVGQGDHAL